MSKQKDNIRKIGRNLKIITAFIVGALILLSIAICVCCGVLAYINEQSIGMEDWLMAGCALLSMFGTIFLACVSVFQSDRANKLNERVIKQNEELQKMNDTQFKIANQNLFPFLIGYVGTVQNMRDINYLPRKGWENGCGRTIELISKVTIDIDSRWNKNNNANFRATTTCTLWNKSAVIISKIEIYKIAINNPLNNVVNVSWELSDSLLNIDGKVIVYFHFYHDYEKFILNREALSFSIFIKMETITGVKFYEKIRILAPPENGECNIDKLSMDEILN